MKWKKWRKWNIIIHRDLGYLAFGMTIVYAVSGIAVNHNRDWNPNYRVQRIETNIGMVADSAVAVTDVLLADVMSRLGETGTVSGTYAVDPQTLQIFLDERSIVLDVQTGDVSSERIVRRRGLQEMNFLHLNLAMGMWTYMADLYAATLLVLAITGTLVLKGKKGITGRGKWLIATGIVIPIVFLLVYF